MNNKMFYSEDEIKNIISKNEMAGVEMTEIKQGDTNTMVKLDGENWQLLTFNELAKMMFPKDESVSAEPADGGVFVTK